jgi:hypothetical protein
VIFFETHFISITAFQARIFGKIYFQIRGYRRYKAVSDKLHNRQAEQVMETVIHLDTTLNSSTQDLL